MVYAHFALSVAGPSQITIGVHQTQRPLGTATALNTHSRSRTVEVVLTRILTGVIGADSLSDAVDIAPTGIGLSAQSRREITQLITGATQNLAAWHTLTIHA